MEKRKVCNSNKFLQKSAKSKGESREDPMQRRVKAEVARLQKATKDAIPKEKREPLMPLFHDLAFLKVKLGEARHQLLHENIFTEYDNGGGQTGLREHPGFAAYNKLFTSYSREIGKLIAIVPSGSAAADTLIDFLNETRGT